MDAEYKTWPLRCSYVFLTALIIFLQFYLISFKLPFDATYTTKTMGFFTLYANKLRHNFSLWIPLLEFFLAHIIIQTSFSIIIYGLTKQIVRFFPQYKRNFFFIGISAWFIGQLNIYLWNWYLFPYSFFSLYLHKLGASTLVLFVLLFATNLLVFACLLILLIKLMTTKPKVVLTVLGMSCILYVSYFIMGYFEPRYFKATQQPNVIIVITDSLRPSYANPAIKNTGLQRVQNLTKNSAFFTNSLSLLGRSTPGLVSILTGNYPRTNGARFNLIPTRYLNLEKSLTHILKSSGYQTIFAADGKQFINLDTSYNFDEIIAAKSGIYDFIFSVINDTPLSNLLTNTTLGEFLFPYNYANRNSYFTYLPSTFIKLVDKKLVNKYEDKPVLFVGVLTIAHWPYVWARQALHDNLFDRYEDSVSQLDQQFSDLLNLLRKRGLLNNAIIVTLSDHGDSLGLPGDRIIAPQNYTGPIKRLNFISRFPYTARQNNNLLGMDTSTGHGTDLLSMTQLQTTLAFYDGNNIKPKIISSRVALIDVLPTLLDLLNIKLPSKLEGISLKTLLLSKKTNTDFNRPLFLESEIDIPLIDVTNSQQQTSLLSRLIHQYANLYDINVINQQLELTSSAIPNLLSEKQRGVIYKDWLLVKFPGKNNLHTYVLPEKSAALKDCYYAFPVSKNHLNRDFFCYRLSPTAPFYVLVNLKTKKWQIFLANEKVANPVFNELLQKLKSYFINEL